RARGQHGRSLGAWRPLFVGGRPPAVNGVEEARKERMRESLSARKREASENAKERGNAGGYCVIRYFSSRRISRFRSVRAFAAKESSRFRLFRVFVVSCSCLLPAGCARQAPHPHAGTRPPGLFQDEAAA